LRYGVEPIPLAGRDEPWHLVAVAGFGEEPILLLTNALEGARDSPSLWGITPIHRTRWKVEETFGFLTHSYHREDLRVMNYQRWKNLVVLVTAAAYFAATFPGQRGKRRILCERLLLIPQRFFGIPPFRFHALADGSRKILSQTSPSPPERVPPSLQLELLLGWAAAPKMGGNSCRTYPLTYQLIPDCNQRARKALWPKEGFCESSESLLRRPPASDFALN
jgi:hypothetical protein